MANLTIPTNEIDAELLNAQSSNDQIQFIQNESGRFGNHSGANSFLNVVEYDNEIKAFDEQLKKEIGVSAFNDYMTMQAPHRKAERDAIARVARQEAIQASDKDNQNKLLSKRDAQLREDKLVFVADSADVLSKENELHKKFETGRAEIDSSLEAQIKRISEDVTKDEATKEAEITQAKMNAVKEKATLALMNNGELEALKKEGESKAFGFIPKITSFSNEIFTSRYTYLMLRGDYNPAQAFADAKEFTRTAMVGYFREFIAAGNSKGIIPILDEMEKRDKESFEASKKIVDEKTGKQKYPDGSINIFDMACCRYTDFQALRDAAQKSLDEEARRGRADVAAQKAAQAQRDDMLKDQADRLELSVKEYFHKNMFTDENPMQTVSKFLPAINALKDAGYKDAAGLYDKLFSAANNTITMREKFAKEAEGKTAEENYRDFQTLWNTYNTTSADEVFLSFLTPNGIVQQNKKTGGTETRAAVIALGSSILRQGNLTDEQKKYYGDIISQAKKAKVENDCRILERLARDVGFELPQDQTKQVFMYRQMAFDTVDGAPSKQVGNDVLFNKDGVVMMGDQMTVTCRADNSRTFSLGKNEAQRIFRDMFHVISQTPTDEAVNEEAYKALVSKFKGALMIAAKESDNNKRLEKITAQFDKITTSTLGRGSTKSLSYITRNYRTPQEHEREIAFRRKAEEYRRIFPSEFDKAINFFNGKRAWDK